MVFTPVISNCGTPDGTPNLFCTTSKKLFVQVNILFKIRPIKNNLEFAKVYLHLTGSGQRQRISLDLKIKTSEWIDGTRFLAKKSKENQDYNLYLKSVNKQLTDIEIIYRLSNLVLTPNIVLRELKNGIPSADFLTFYKVSMGERSEAVNTGTYDWHHSVYMKLKNWRQQILFTEIDFKFFEDYKLHYRKSGNGETTLNGNIASIKKYLNIAVKSGIKLRINLQDVKVGTTRGNRTSLTSVELKKILEHYYSEFTTEHDKLVCGYFLFSCMTGLRISDVQKTTRKNLADDYISFVTTKTAKDQSIILNNTAKKIIEYYEPLFVRKITDQKINESLKKIAAKLDINKSISFHVARHTFATTFLRAGGSVEKLQLLLGHSNINETMIYVHILAEEANKDILLIDNFLN